jgi:tRNA(Arg) A34 adenosine deaminase TadA
MQKRKKKKWMSRARNRAKERTRAEHVKSMGVVVVDRSIRGKEKRRTRGPHDT